MSKPRIQALLIIGVAIGLLIYFLQPGGQPVAPPAEPSATGTGASPVSAVAPPSSPAPAIVPPPRPPEEADAFEGIERLNAAGYTARDDLVLLSDLLASWQTLFPRQGNPWGNNADITAALSGNNPRAIALLPRRHPAINAEGELVDRWGTPYFFHQLSGTRMEIRSAGPDRQLYTDDDVNLSP